MAASNPPQPNPPYLSPHAAERWNDRAATTDLDPWTAWTDGVPVELPFAWGIQSDEARYHPDAKVVLCRTENSLPTVYDVTGPDSHRTIRRAVENQLDISLENNR